MQLPRYMGIETFFILTKGLESNPLQLPRYMGIETPILPVKRLAVLLQLPRYMGIETD